MEIWKYTLPVNRGTKLEMPKNARVLSAQNQHGEVTIWAEVAPWDERETRTFSVVGTADEFDGTGLRFIDTVQTGILEWHVYEHVGAKVEARPC